MIAVAIPIPFTFTGAAELTGPGIYVVINSGDQPACIAKVFYQCVS